MTTERNGSASRRRVVGGVGGRAHGRMGFTLLGLLWVGLLGLFWVPGVLSAAGQQASAPTAGGALAAGLPAAQGEEALISAYDVLFIQVFDVEQMTREYRVSGTGTVDFPLLPDPVPVAGLSSQQAAKAISQRCIAAGVLSHPVISVTVRESRMHSVAVAGAVKNPQIYPVFGRISLLDLLTLAGGVDADAGSVVTITRGDVSRRLLAAQTGNGPATGNPAAAPASLDVNLQQLIENGDPSLNSYIYPGDRVTVQRAGVIYILGAVNRAGGYRLSEARQNMTVLKAVALAGYLGPFAKAKNIVLLRIDPSAPTGRDQIPINLKAMLKGSLADRPMQDNDILFVPDATLMRALHRGADLTAAATTYASTALIVQ